MNKPPQVVVLAGPNGAGKSTTAERLLVGELGVAEFVNADVIARGLSGFNSEQVAIRAGRIMLDRIHELAAARTSFAFETTLASRSFAALLSQLKQNGYVVRLNFLWLPNPEMAIDRVAARVQLGGHSIPIETVRRRYFAGLVNFFNLYQPLADDWFFFDNSGDAGAQLIASGGREQTTAVVEAEKWAHVNQLRTA